MERCLEAVALLKATLAASPLVTSFPPQSMPTSSESVQKPSVAILSDAVAPVAITSSTVQENHVSVKPGAPPGISLSTQASSFHSSPSSTGLHPLSTTNSSKLPSPQNDFESLSNKQHPDDKSHLQYLNRFVNLQQSSDVFVDKKNSCNNDGKKLVDTNESAADNQCATTAESTVTSSPSSIDCNSTAIDAHPTALITSSLTEQSPFSHARYLIADNTILTLQSYSLLPNTSLPTSSNLLSDQQFDSLFTTYNLMVSQYYQHIYDQQLVLQQHILTQNSQKPILKLPVVDLPTASAVIKRYPQFSPMWKWLLLHRLQEVQYVQRRPVMSTIPMTASVMISASPMEHAKSMEIVDFCQKYWEFTKSL
jgi:hypothetical protein